MAYCSSTDPPPPPPPPPLPLPPPPLAAASLIIHHHLKLFDLQIFAEPVPKSAFVCLHDSLVICQKRSICLVTSPEITGEKKKRAFIDR